MFDRICAFISYYYMRYLLATELYLLEKWERHTSHAMALILFLGLLYLNMSIVGALSSFFTNQLSEQAS